MGGLKPGARSALVKLMLPSHNAVRGRGIKVGPHETYPVTRPMQSWQVVQTLKTGEPVSPLASETGMPASMANIGQSADIVG